MLLRITDRGLYCEAGEFYIDPWQPVDRAVITHAHGDHARWGSRHYLGSEEGLRVLRPHGEAPFALAHHPTHVDGAYVLAGHVHPAARMHGAGRERARLPCFWFGAGCAVLPAFGEFTGLADVQVSAGDRIWVTAGAEVIALAALDPLQNVPG